MWNVSDRHGGLSDEPGDIVHKQTDENDAESGEEQFAAQLDSERHTVVLDEADMKPGEDFVVLPEVEVSFDPEFENLVADDYSSNHQPCRQCEFTAFGELHVSDSDYSLLRRRVWRGALHGVVLSE